MVAVATTHPGAVVVGLPYAGVTQRPTELQQRFTKPSSEGTQSSSGVVDLDELLGIHVGDNVVWLGDDRALLRRFASPFLAVGDGGRRRLVVTGGKPMDVDAAVEVLDARPRRTLADPVALERELLDGADHEGERVVVDGLDDLVRRWGRDRAVGFFTRTCPRLFDAGAIAYWTASRAVLGGPMVEEVRRVTQCVLELSDGRLRVLKAEGRSAGAQGTMVAVRVDADGAVHLERELALGRLAEGLRRIRGERRLSQAELARLAGVSPSAVSQAEAGRRGLSLDTLLVLCDQLGIGLDELLGRAAPSEYVLARRDRRRFAGSIAPLLDDPRAGLRLNLVRLAGGEAGGPPTPHKDVELVVVAGGLVLVDLGTATPVLRAGDAVLATRAGVLGWRNLVAEPAVLFWVLRDEVGLTTG
jgi:transcriptional regulator with XRE-family HTH domain